MAVVQSPLFVPPAGSINIREIERSLWEAADQLRANSKLKSSEYSVPVLGLIFLRYADQRFAQVHAELAASAQTSARRRGITKEDYQARGVVYLPEETRFRRLLELPRRRSRPRTRS